MARTSLMVASLLCALLVAGVLIWCAEGIDLGVLLFLFWELLPLALVMVLARRLPPAPGGEAIRTPIVTFGIVALGITVWEYLDFIYYMNTANPPSSTSALVFLVYPIVAIVPALVAALVAQLFALFWKRYAHS